MKQQIQLIAMMIFIVQLSPGCRSASMLDEWPRLREGQSRELEMTISSQTNITACILYPHREYDPTYTQLLYSDEARIHHWRIQKKVEISESADIKALASALGSGMRESAGDAAFCFEPRHALVLSNGERIIICFDCSLILRFKDECEYYQMTTDSPEARFDEIFKKYGLDNRGQDTRHRSDN